MDNYNKSSDEVDLGQLFHLIGGAFRRLYYFIVEILDFIFKTIISFFLFIQKHLVKLFIAGVVGLCIGFILDSFKEDTYRSTMIVEPNLGSTRQLYSNIDLYSELIRSEDTLELGRIFKIENYEAASLVNFDVKAVKNRSSMLRVYNRYLSDLDTINRNYITFEDFVENFDPLDAEIHAVVVDATNDHVAKKLEPILIASIANNPYYQLKKETADLNIETSKLILSTQLKDIDTLKNIYNQVILNESKSAPSTGGTTISLSDRKIETKEFELLEETRTINEELQELNIRKIENLNIINVISTFPIRGIKLSLWKRNSSIILMPILCISLTFIGLCLLGFNSYLKSFRVKQ